MKCDICGKELTKKKVYRTSGLILCGKHYAQKRSKGRFLDDNPTSCKDPNEYAIDKENNTARIFLYKKGFKIEQEAIIDLEDLDRVIKKKWRYWKGNICTGDLQITRLPYFILNISPRKGKVIDHKNSNPLDNRKSNLRLVTQNENLLNRRILSNNTSEFAGVWYDNKRHRWAAEIKRDGIKCFLGRHLTRPEAVYARYLAEIIVFKEFRSELNDTNIKKEIAKCSNKSSIKNYVKQRIKLRYNINIE